MLASWEGMPKHPGCHLAALMSPCVEAPRGWAGGRALRAAGTRSAASSPCQPQGHLPGHGRGRAGLEVTAGDSHRLCALRELHLPTAGMLLL